MSCISIREPDAATPLALTTREIIKSNAKYATLVTYIAAGRLSLSGNPC
jgi:hypothetical protein